MAIPITTYQQTYGYNDSVTVYSRASGGAAVMEKAKDEVRVMHAHPPSLMPRGS